MTTDKATAFAALHVKGKPLVLYNIWDAGSAKAVAAAGAPALATGSWSVAAAHGYADGEAIPLGLVETIVARIAATTDLPLSVDFESGYAADADTVAQNVRRMLKAGAIGINFEDGKPDGSGLYPIERQTACIAAIRAVADSEGVPLFINARTDFFLQERDDARHKGLMTEAIGRARAYADAGANGFFVPGLASEELIAEVCASVSLPVNIMAMGSTPPIPRLAELGVSRLSYGPGAYRQAMAGITAAAKALYDGEAEHSA
ncbi:isocitrate lyase/phosphoenolpyruvate mutase family protein [Agrobacterium sp. a22-2]|uniref:isocitrate lyase/PEP mutase family protein n=1 Tax=Agrobacterium sp. a22-2 TaxID=2283840 RepID=UPI001445FF43|nr:isocitrate lyase/phosphoenolpyruvate mutase family protein [Agrobacterium sp. a22-2]NKN37937.1 isocitrate lyase/phosphoenolpyruvate mutase family protein [Agrobacterium sp. a22-2]